MVPGVILTCSIIFVTLGLTQCRSAHT
ncbi:hypothetical protein CGLO_18112 [Colletotrichum gloeosporioides Cg-14]|uniref:Uncharacterized protein n=1 Tax=Colletotrichum gloeosporioides (strain Cg-14) TaxID=1237896 RepID=T0L4T1_COLGC|nr:hypothetical protein CGLO_18112 [Colletotrichum gloeosporioides Cg-14]